MTHYDLFVIGGGSGGVAAARASAALGAKVGIAEGDAFGGTCVNRGCMPKKWYWLGSHFTQQFENAKSYGWEFDAPRLDWPTLKARTFKEITRLNGIYDTMLSKAEVDVHRAFASFIDARTLQVGDQQVTADKIMIAVGGKPSIPAIDGAEHGLTSDEIFHIEPLPKRLLVIGAGYIAVEFAGIFNALGVEVTLMARKDKVLRGFDEDVRNHLAEEMRKKGVHLQVNTSPQRIEKREDGSFVVTAEGGEQFATDLVLFATGRVSNFDHLGLANTAVALDGKNKIIVDEWQQTSVPTIYAVGDSTNTHFDLTPVAINEGRAFADTHFGAVKRNFEDFITPTAVFSQPPIGTVGLSEEEARERYEKIDIYRTVFRPSLFALSDTIEEKLLMKLVVDATTDKVVGAHMVGPEAGEIIQLLGVAMRAGATKHDFDRTVGVHPTLAEEFVTMREKVAG